MGGRNVFGLVVVAGHVKYGDSVAFACAGQVKRLKSRVELLVGNELDDARAL